MLTLSTGCRDYPDEKGTESTLQQLVFDGNSLDAGITPMKRGLKEPMLWRSGSSPAVMQGLPR